MSNLTTVTFYICRFQIKLTGDTDFFQTDDTYLYTSYITGPNTEKVSIPSSQNIYLFCEKFIRDIKLNGNMVKAQIDISAFVCSIKATAMLRAESEIERMESVLEGLSGGRECVPREL